MKTLLEEYGLAIFAAIAVLGMIVFISPLGSKVKEVLFNQAEQEGNIIVNASNASTSTDLKRIHAAFDTERNLQDSSNFSYIDVYNNKILNESIGDKIEALADNDGWENPLDKQGCTDGVPSGDTFPSYSDGSPHTGTDFTGNQIGTEVKAPSNGIVVVSSNGCQNGFLGDKCHGTKETAIAGGGNQVWFLTAVDGEMYLLAFFHLNNSFHALETTYNQGDKIGEVGTSGSSTGPHLHIEAFKLGDADIDGDGTTDYKEYMEAKHSISWGTGWGAVAVTRSNICGNGVDPETINADTGDNAISGAACRFNAREIFPVQCSE